VHKSVAVGAEGHLPGFGVGHSRREVFGHGASAERGHQATGAEHFGSLAERRHHGRGGHGTLKAHGGGACVAYVRRKGGPADDVSASRAGALGLLALGESCDTETAAQAVR
jgi:hypothetical protein